MWTSARKVATSLSTVRSVLGARSGVTDMAPVFTPIGPEMVR